MMMMMMMGTKAVVSQKACLLHDGFAAIGLCTFK